MWRAFVRCLPRVAAVAVCLGVTELLGLPAAGRDITWLQVGYYAPTLLVAVAVTAVVSGAVLAARIGAAAAGVRSRSHGRTPGPADTGTQSAFFSAADRSRAAAASSVRPNGSSA
ncbi:hypothetical protein CLV63_10913 [Murinocardiopsis flavida]|uniref:Uncharacterized protein n=1 Tax=Murinocardiopsis flavida TaxID=645275 RepID=A0A2P8DIG3_9ACTN|nr:hypothetical protein [Murinocardiopsis flavida]PSK97010.1 hypothetical protein CLV63_10913 [Murinocardiopsis flavida]